MTAKERLKVKERKKGEERHGEKITCDCNQLPSS